MTITLDIRPEVEAELARQAAVQGGPVEAYAADLLEEVVQMPQAEAAKGPASDLVELFEPVRGLLTDEEIDILFRSDPSPARSVDLS